MTLPKRLIIEGCAYALDGGTTSVQAVDEAGRKHGVTLIQHAFPQPSRSLDAIPGRLYFDGQLVPMRSSLEAEVLRLLRTADIRFQASSPEGGGLYQLSPNALILGEDIREVVTGRPDEVTRTLAARIVEFVESQQYLRFADRVEQAADETRYSVWVACDPERRKQILVRLAQADGIGLQGARKFLEEQRPLAVDVSALEVSDLAARYRAKGLDIRVQPAFRWGLP